VRLAHARTGGHFRAELRIPPCFLAADVQLVRGAGEFTSPHCSALAVTQTIQIAVWLGDDWRQPLAPILHTLPIEVMSTARAAQVAARDREAPALQQQLEAARTPRGLVALYPTVDDGAAEPVSAVAARLREAGLGAAIVDAATVVNPGVLTPQVVDALVLCGCADHAGGVVRLHRRLRRGGGQPDRPRWPAFPTPLYDLDGQWWTPRLTHGCRLGRSIDGALDFETGDMGDTSRSPNAPAMPVDAELVGGVARPASKGCLRVDQRGLSAGTPRAAPVRAARATIEAGLLWA